MKPFLIIPLFIYIYSIIGCEKKGADQPEPIPLQVEEVTSTNDTLQPVITIPTGISLQPTRPVANYPFDWENAHQMPVPAGKAPVPVPWSEQAIRNYDPGLRFDYKKSDGWELVYNNFTDVIEFDNRVFILYNKFRGLLRYYLYNTRPGNPAVDSYQSLINEIWLSQPMSTPLLNYAGQFIVDLDANARSASLIEPWPIREGGWYITQFELAYDQQITTYTSRDCGIAFTLAFARVDELSINNTPARNKNIYLEKPGLRFTSSAALGPAIGENMQAHVKSIQGFNELSGLLPAATINNLRQAINDSTAGNILSATLSPGLNLADCKLNLTVLFRQHQNLVGWIPAINFPAPGTDSRLGVGLSPLFNEPAGIFYLAKKPVIKHTTINGDLREQYALDVSSIEYIINPFTRAYADIRRFRQEIVAVESTNTRNLTEAKMYKGKILKASAPIHALGVRVSFEVVPKNGSAPVRIIKTFKANIVEG
ncbi:hypothetical protein [Longitalea arenae]|uniref:hypothetical protein n=1 Tax=Longitalea arenae TaxID=2812558 RepID=UPI00196808F8|nr:hypothetical protein [Longitalea arenae]